MAAAISRTVAPFGFSLDTGEAMNSNRSVLRCPSSGKTRTPLRPTTIDWSLRTLVIGTQFAELPVIAMPQSIS